MRHPLVSSAEDPVPTSGDAETRRRQAGTPVVPFSNFRGAGCGTFTHDPTPFCRPDRIDSAGRFGLDGVANEDGSFRRIGSPANSPAFTDSGESRLVQFTGGRRIQNSRPRYRPRVVGYFVIALAPSRQSSAERCCASCW
jgi:hypothetical protein